MNTPTPQPHPPKPRRNGVSRRTGIIAAITLGLGLPVLLLAGVLLVIGANADRLPPDIALHWGLDGPDRFGTVGQLIRENAVIGSLLLLISGLTLAITARQSRRLGAGMAAGIGSFLPLATLVTVLPQFDLATGQGAPLNNWGMLAAILGALAIGTIAALFVPFTREEAATAGPVPASAPRLPPSGEALTWDGSVGPTRGVLIGITALLLPVLLLSIWLATAGTWVALVIMAVTSALTVATLFFHLHIDADGLTARSAIGIPTFRVPLDQVVRADIRTVSPFGEFGGWGYRTNGFETGIVTRKGEALVVERASGGRFVVTVDDAETAARTLNTLAASRDR
nr:hypothetical protein [Actinomycetales bacterium]